MKMSTKLIAQGPPLLIIAGPTASGKSTVALQCAEALNGEVLNVDSVQVYRGLDIGSAKISPEQRTQVPHHGIDIREPSEPFNVADFLEFARPVLTDIRTRGKQPIVCAGTTMYLTSLLHGLVDAPKANPELRSTLQSMSDEQLREELLRIDEEAAKRIHLHDRVRTIRAIEAGKGGSELSALHAGHRYSETVEPALIVVLCWERKELYQRIDARAEAMVSQGLLQEARTLHSRYGDVPQAFCTLGYAQALQVLKGEIAESDLASEIAMYTRRYAKRQTTFWRNEPKKRGWNISKSGPSTFASGVRAIQELRGVSMSPGELISEARAYMSVPREDITLWYVEARSILES